MEGDRRERFVYLFGVRFSDALKAAGLSRSEAARRLGHSTQARIAEYATGTRLPPLDTLTELVERLELDPAVLFPVWFSQAKRRDTGRVADGEAVHV